MDEPKLHQEPGETSPIVYVIGGAVLFCLLASIGVVAYWAGVLP